MNNFKILLLGDGNVGKTAFIKSFLQDSFEEIYIPTLDLDIFSFSKENNIYNFWDYAGQDKYRGIKNNFRNAQGVIFFFDLSNENSLKNLKNWIENCYRVTGNIPFVIVGLKFDMIQTIKDEDIYRCIGNAPFVKVSSKTKENLEKPFEILKIV